MKTTGIFGGTFNPPHNEHIAICRSAKQELGLDRIVVLPTSVPPHKSVGESEADFMAGKLAAKTPIGQALMGHCVGDVVEAKVPAGIIKFEILEITL